MTREQATALIGERFGGAQVEGEPAPPLVVTAAGRSVGGRSRSSPRTTLGCRFFSFLTAVDWKEQGLEVVAKVDNLDDRVSMMMKTRLGPGVSECPSLDAGLPRRRLDGARVLRHVRHPLRRPSGSAAHPAGDDWEGHPLLKSYAVDTPHPPYR